jgi:hypothetical protein
MKRTGKSTLWKTSGVEPQSVYDMLSPLAAKCMAQEQIGKFIELWDSINSKRGYPWDSNPWVWVVEFKVREE